MQHQEIPRHQDRRSPQGADSSSTWLSRVATDDPIEVAQREDEIVRLKRRIHERLVEELDLKKLDLAALSNQARMAELRQKTERVITNLLTKEVGGLVASHEVRSRLVKEIADEALGLGPLEELLDDGDVTDILVNNKDQIYVERHGKLELTAKKFVSDEQVRTVIERIVAPMGRRVDEANPMVDARLPDGSRVNAIIPPLSLRGSVLSIRKFGRERLTLDELIRLQALTDSMGRFLQACVRSRKNIIVSGGTGSGKTTMLNVLSAFIPDHERIITLEDAAELRLAQTHWISLEARPANIEGRGQIGVRDLFRNALRMRPDRIIIGECRGEETLDMLQAMNTGHDGSLTTVHANSPKDVISRLDAMVLMSNIELPVRAIREMVASAIDVIVHTARMADGSRKVTTVSEVLELSAGGEVIQQELFAFRQTGTEKDGGVVGEFVTTGKTPTFLTDLKVKGLSVDESLFAPGVAPVKPLPRAALSSPHAGNGAAP
jgi:pilus assembly protein CpaF